MTVLVVEDQSNLLEPLQDQLEETGHSCLTACDVDEADWTLQTVHVDVLVLDLDIPKGEPLAWLEGLGLARPALASATVAITGRALDSEDILRIEAFGASVLRKPFPIQELREAVLELARRPADEAAAGNGGRARGLDRTDDLDES